MNNFGVNSVVGKKNEMLYALNTGIFPFLRPCYLSTEFLFFSSVIPFSIVSYFHYVYKADESSFYIVENT